MRYLRHIELFVPDLAQVREVLRAHEDDALALALVASARRLVSRILIYTVVTASSTRLLRALSLSLWLVRTETAIVSGLLRERSMVYGTAMSGVSQGCSLGLVLL